VTDITSIMGQSISKRVMPRLSKLINSHESVMKKDALDEIARKKTLAKFAGNKYSDPNAAQYGFKRDTATKSAKEQDQVTFLKELDKDTPQEIPDDLLKFLNDAGPASQTIDKELTSPRVRDMKEDERKSHQNQSNKLRKRRKMPMVENLGEGTPSDGLTTERTTSFSTTVRDKNESHTRFSHFEVFEMLKKSQFKNAEVISKERLESIANSQLEEHVILNGSNPIITDSQKVESTRLLLNVIKYNGSPVLMEDTDKSLVGAWSDRVEELNKIKVRIAGAQVQLAMESGLNEMKKKSKDKIKKMNQTN